ncbi:hypothetical protein EVAR_55178_1 [Eumeta japonica]|uniref:Uncharacterized protein n=1 Tax=Eumeta variegata TaxID=151549 RepID=A0A4C1Y6R6_EUMVA|nr:hypothetical protein EVAR_55178_1 [Eumeta japonica]
MPLPSLDMGRLWNVGRKVDWSDGKGRHVTTKYQPDPPKFETGGFEPILPTTAGGFMPIPNPSVNVTHNINSVLNSMNYSNEGGVYENISVSAVKDPIKIIHSNTTHKKTKTEIHELQAFTGNDSNAEMTFNRTKNVQEQNAIPNQVTKYNLMETNVTITKVTEKEGLLITTDTSSDMSLPSWLETTTMAYTPSLSVTTKPPIRKHAESQPTALSAVFVPNIEDSQPRKEQSKRPATITKVKMPQVEQYDFEENFALVNNRNGKTSFTDDKNLGNTKTRHSEGAEWCKIIYTHMITSLFNYEKETKMYLV